MYKKTPIITTISTILAAFLLTGCGSGSDCASCGSPAAPASPTQTDPDIDVTDTTVEVTPNAPAALKTTTLSSSSIVLNWADNSNVESGYEIYRNGKLIYTTGANVSSYTDTGLNPLTQYSYEVKAINKEGSSNAVLANGTTLDTIPNSPSNLNIATKSASSFDLEWTDNSGNETGFKIYRDGILIHTTKANVTSYTDTDRSPGKTYNYEVRAANDLGDSSSVSKSAMITLTLTLISQPDSKTNKDTVTVWINGTQDTNIFVNAGDSGNNITTLDGTALLLDTSGEDGNKNFVIVLKDDNGYESNKINLAVTKDTITPKYWIWETKPVQAGTNNVVTISFNETISKEGLTITPSQSGAVSNIKIEGNKVTFNYDKSSNDEVITIIGQDLAGNSIDLSQKYRTVLKTGLTASAANFDDGYHQKGTARSHSRSDDIVTDKITGLMWQDEAYTEEEKKVYNQNSYKEEDGKVLKYHNAISYCDTLSLGGFNDWRLPEIEELVTITNKGSNDPSIDSIFQNSESYVYHAMENAVLAFLYGDIHHNEDTNKSLYTRCVRGEKLSSNGSSFKENDTVIDTSTGLMWQDDESAAAIQKNWSEAVSYCENLTLTGKNDWRLPNFNELYSIANDAQINSASDKYWTSTTDASLSSYANLINFDIVDSGSKPITEEHYVRCVRDLD